MTEYCERCGAEIDDPSGDEQDVFGPLQEVAGMTRGSSEEVLCEQCREEDRMLGTALIDFPL